MRFDGVPRGSRERGCDGRRCDRGPAHSRRLPEPTMKANGCLPGQWRAVICTVIPLVFLRVSAAAQQIDPATYQRVVEENIELRREQERLARDNAELRKQNAGLILDVKELETKREQMAAVIAQLKTPDETRAEIARLQAERATLVTEVSRLRQTLNLVPPALTNAPAPSPGPEPGSSLFRKLEQENSDLRDQIAREREALQLETKAREALQGQMTDLQVQLGRMAENDTLLKRNLAQAKTTEGILRKALAKIARKSFLQQEEIEKLRQENSKQEAAKARDEAQGGALPATSVSGAAKRDVVQGANEVDVLGQAQRSLKAGRTKEAEKLYLQALQRSPGNSRIHYDLGVLYADYIDDPERAAYHLRKYLEANPAAADADQVRAWLVELDMRVGM